MATKAKSPERMLAERIARDLFTNSCQERAQRLVLTIDTPTGRDLGGWNERVVADKIERAIVAEVQRPAIPTDGEV